MLLECGCTPNSYLSGKPVCAIHLQLTTGATKLVEEIPTELLTRMARCGYCGSEAASKDYKNLAFFQYKPNQKTDNYYCGCRGFD